ncbi:MAG: hypothetical protein J3Q66DRAFT_173653 [Benniella sp.]|nr:MAG: hypothetical protein J3Q66DRAFT_173653 [Benniella sp.]
MAEAFASAISHTSLKESCLLGGGVVTLPMHVHVNQPCPPLPSQFPRPFAHTHERNRPMDPPPSPSLSLHKVDADGNSAPTDFLCRWKGCGKVLATRKSLNAHEKIHREKADGTKFNCTVPGCGRSFETTRSRRAHELRFKHVLRDSFPYPPLPSSKLRPFVHTHERNRPMDPPPSPSPSSGHDDEMSDDLGPQEGERDTADHLKTSEAEPEVFRRTIPNYELVLETDDLLSAHGLQCEKRLAAQQYPCPEPGCDESFSTAHKLLRHRSVHKVNVDGNSAPTDFLCRWKGCGKVLATRKSVKDHEQIHREKADGTKFNCTVPGCGKSFETTRSRRAHELRFKHVLRDSFAIPSLNLPSALLSPDPTMNDSRSTLESQ